MNRSVRATLGKVQAQREFRKEQPAGPKQPQLLLRLSQQHRPEPKAQAYPSVRLVYPF